MSKSGGGAGLLGAVSVLNKLCQRKSIRSAKRFATVSGKGSRYHTRRRLIARNTDATSRSTRLSATRLPYTLSYQRITAGMAADGRCNLRLPAGPLPSLPATNDHGCWSTVPPQELEHIP